MTRVNLMFIRLIVKFVMLPLIWKLTEEFEDANILDKRMTHIIVSAYLIIVTLTADENLDTVDFNYPKRFSKSLGKKLANMQDFILNEKNDLFNQPVTIIKLEEIDYC